MENYRPLYGETAAEFDAIIEWRALNKDIELFEKGFNFLYHIQKVIGGPQHFEPYMKAHLILDNIQWDAWLNAPGMPLVKNEFKHALANACHELADRWHHAQDNQVFDEFLPNDIKNFTPEQKRWQQVCLKSEYDPIFSHVVKFVAKQGRMKYVRSLYRLLNQTKNGSELAKKTLEKISHFIIQLQQP
ncbi:leukotriene A-4 hydrol [Gigaspora margarita]|uniref:Leukotriene A-4 hydrol n=1 Tax=Gigaspora margarita TaxID=4874 RepID=A0A8H4B2F8_GIGMA|nr:leukotriene A-4 hydrol [Gigaspora margarita]